MAKIVVRRKPVSYKYAIKLLDVQRFTLYSLGSTPLIACISDQIPPLEEVYTALHEAVLERLAQEAKREQRNKYRPERKRPWSPTKTKVPFQDAASKRARDHTLKDDLKIATAVVEKLGSPWNSSKMGRKPHYSPKKLVAAILVKEIRGGMSFESLSTELKNQGYDARTEEAKEKEEKGSRSPCPSQLHWAMTKIPEDYLKKALQILDQMAAEEHTKLFGEENLPEYSVDSTDDTGTTLKEVTVAMKTELHRQTVKYGLLVRLVTNTVVAVEASKNKRDARPLLSYVPPGATVYLDADYDVEYNYEYGQERRITLIVYPKLYGEKPYKGRHRHQAQKDFSKKKYGRRKLVERPIGNREARDGSTLNYRRPDMQRKGLLLKYIAHNIRALFTQQAWPEILRPVQFP